MEESIKFLLGIYSKQCNGGDHIILAKKKGSSWRDIPLVYGPNLEKDLRAFFHSHPPSSNDLYWSPMAYSHPRRQNKYARDTKFLCQDIDECADPQELSPPPSHIWESSPNKYQGLWELDRYLEDTPTKYTPLNKALAKHLGCDDCFDLPHVYRIPGTINHKYRDKPPVGRAKGSKIIYKPRTLGKLVKLDPPKAKGDNSPMGGIQERKIYAKYNIPKRIKDLLAMDNLDGLDRSNTIWYVENSLSELGMSPPEIIQLIKNSTFNKYRGRADEDERLQSELLKVINNDLVEEEEKGPDHLTTTSYEGVMSNCNSFEGWQVKGFWGRKSHGIVAGMPKCFKSTLVHDLVISIASGKDFLGRFPVLEPGPVIVVQNENADHIMKDRTEKIITDRDLTGNIRESGETLSIDFPPELPITFINQQGFSLSNPSHRKQIERLIEEKGPVLVVFDPLYLMFEGDLNSSKDLNPILNWLLSLKTRYNTSVLLVHHYNKGGGQQSPSGGARMAGSIMLYGWVESAWYLSKVDEPSAQEKPGDNPDEVDESTGTPTVTLNREFRMAGTYPEVNVHFEMGEVGDPSYKVTLGAPGKPHITVKNLEAEIMVCLESTKRALSKGDIYNACGGSKTSLNEALDRLVKTKKVIVTNKGYTISK